MSLHDVGRGRLRSCEDDMTHADRHHEDSIEARSGDPATDRRAMLGGLMRLAAGGLVLGGGLGSGLAGCASSVRRVARPMPDLPTATPMSGPTRAVVSAPSAPSARDPFLAAATGAGLSYQPRERWTSARPRTSDMRRNPTSLTDITIHHDGLGTPLSSTTEGASKARLDLIRRAHVGQGWSDIGYHFAIDRGGRVWQCRPLEWEGAHVKSHNPGNIGILVAGNFMIERPTTAQLDALNSFVNMTRRTYGIPVSRVRTHCEWKDAATSCPGKHLQPKVQSMRNKDFKVV